MSSESILLVDDTPANLRILAEMLRESGYHVRPVTSGAMALRAAESDPPDLILLDIRMPEMDGFEVCRRLKESDSLRSIPIIFISALSDTSDKIKAFEQGGVDYITKPFQFDEVRVRVETHCKLERLRNELKTQNQQLAEANEQLRRLDRLRENLTNMIVHDLRSPLLGIKGYLDLARKVPAAAGDEMLARFLDNGLKSAASMTEMIGCLLDVTRLEEERMPFDIQAHELRRIVQASIDELGALVLARKIGLDIPDEPVPVRCDGDLTKRVLINLLGNAIKFSGQEGRITVSICPVDSVARVDVCDTGPGIPEAFLDEIFERYGQVKAWEEHRRVSSGLGLAFCRLAVEGQGGRIGVQSKEGEGSTFWFELPRSLAAEA
jgi:signal transduction histidine kinase